MKLPNGDQAIIDDAKLLDYCLLPTHPRGRHKARLFAAALGFNRHHVAELRTALLIAVRSEEAIATKRNDFGQLYEISFDCVGPAGRARVLSVWVILDSESFPRLVTAYPV